MLSTTTHASRTRDTMRPSLSLSAVDQYLREVRGLARLGDGDEDQLLVCLAAGGAEAEAARTRLVEAYQPLAIRLARGYADRAKHLTFLDFVQEGNLGLLEALRRHD